MYGLIIGLCLAISFFDVCLIVSKKARITDSEREQQDQEQMECVEKLFQKRK